MIDYHVSSTGRHYAFFDRNGENGIIGYGRTIEEAFEGAAAAMFGLITEPSHVHPVQTVPLSFIETDVNPALVRWLDLLLKSARQEKVVFSEFVIEREGRLWRGCATGEPWKDAEHRVEEKMALVKIPSVRQKAAWWRACCTLRPQMVPRRRRDNHDVGAPY